MSRCVYLSAAPCAKQSNDENDDCHSQLMYALGKWKNGKMGKWENEKMGKFCNIIGSLCKMWWREPDFIDNCRHFSDSTTLIID